LRSDFSANSVRFFASLKNPGAGLEIALECVELIAASTQTFSGVLFMIPSNSLTARTTTAAVALLGAIVLATPLFAASGDAMATTKSSAASTKQEMAATAPEDHGVASVEARIKELHSRLHITEAQKTQWDNLAQVMRENAQAMVDMKKQRAADAKSMTAVDVVKSYSEVIQAHEEGMKKFVPAFEDLYNSLSDSQKKIADSMFRGRARAEAKKVASKES
jgi:protein CpxP